MISNAFSSMGAVVSGVSGEKHEISFSLSRHSLVRPRSPMGAIVAGVSGEKQETSFFLSHHSFGAIRAGVVDVDGVEGESRGKDGLSGDLTERLRIGERRYVHHPWDWGLSGSRLVLTVSVCPVLFGVGGRLMSSQVSTDNAR